MPERGFRKSDPKPATGRARARSQFSLAPTCAKCGVKREKYNYVRLERHHKDGNPLNNDPSNIETLCRNCHMEVDGRIIWNNPDKWHECIICGQKKYPLRKGRCEACNSYRRYHGHDKQIS